MLMIMIFRKGGVMIMARIGQVVYKENQECRREFIKHFNSFKNGQSGWQIWQDFIYMAAAALSQPCDFKQNREDEYLQIINKYNKEEQDLFPQMLATIIEAFEQEQFADILGDLYMQLDMGNKWHGQFFTPYHICYMMSKMSEETKMSIIQTAIEKLEIESKSSGANNTVPAIPIYNH
jgi:type I restriction-modification system DNA methylase subunit